MLLHKRFKNKSNFGFSLIELLIVVALLALISFLSANFLFYTDKILVRSELDKLHAFCIALQYKAQLKNETLSLNLNPEDNSYSFDNQVYYLSQFVKFGVLDNIKGPPSMPNKVLNQSITFKKENSKHVINFYPDGTISAGALYIIDSRKTWQFALSISVAQVSYARRYIYERSGNKWILI